MTDCVDSDSKDEIDVRTKLMPAILQGQKSWRHGRISYASGHVQQLEENHHQEYNFLRSKVNASNKYNP